MDDTIITNKPDAKTLVRKEAIADYQQGVLERFDFDTIFESNDIVRNFFEKWDNQDGVKLMDRMTAVMKNLKQIVEWVKSRRISVEMGKREIAEFQKEIKEINDMLASFVSL